MNITDYIVEYLKSGKRVSINGVGVLSEQETTAYYDRATSTFYPTRRSVTIEQGAVDESDFIKFLADKECVSATTATQIWKNYTDAVVAKLKSEGTCMLSGLGTISSKDGVCTMTAEEQTPSNLTLPQAAPVQGLKTWTLTDKSSPFDYFDNPDMPRKSSILLTGDGISLETSEPEPMPEPEPVSEPEPMPEPIPEPEPEPEPEQEPEPEPEPEVEPEVVPEPEPEPEPEVEPEPEPEPEPDPEPIINTLHQLDAIDHSVKEDESVDNKNKEEKKKHKEKKKKEHKHDDDKKKEKKKRKGGFWKALLWIILILIVLLACLAAVDHYLLNSRCRQWASSFIPQLATEQPVAENEWSVAIPTDYDREAARDNITPYTFSMEGIQYSSDEIDIRSQKVVSDMTPYLSNFLKQRKMSKYEDEFLAQVELYVNGRLTELLTDDEFYGQSLLTYKDYVREYNMPAIKERKMGRKTIGVQSELFESSTLETILSQIIPAEETIPEPVVEKPKADKKAKAAKPIASHIATKSKQGFDVIAGFSVNKSNADALCRSLKSKGCDAYIINRNGLYYVSMGSAASRTEIEARYNHIKEWYKGDISIKKW